MPVIAIEEDDLDEVSRLLSEVPVPDIICPTTISIGPPSTEDTKEDNHHRQANNEDLGGNNQYDANDDDDDDAESFNSNSTFELCSISSYENLADYNKNNNNNISPNHNQNLRRRMGQRVRNRVQLRRKTGTNNHVTIF
mmetsp:Transcript_11925/g.25209  ORF Transcript_11925/g.25209 Transcript_11925/m.25209 type:complete len:139 (+) Transcript_11925:619-1035(+)